MQNYIIRFGTIRFSYTNYVLKVFFPFNYIVFVVSFFRFFYGNNTIKG